MAALLATAAQLRLPLQSLASGAHSVNCSDDGSLTG